jgi:hypothetical protein
MRKTLMCGLAVLFVAMASGAGAEGPRLNCERAGIEGTWLSVMKMGDTPFMQSLTTFTSDGRTTMLLPTGPLPGDQAGAPGDSRVGCTGEWRQAGRRTFDVTMYCLWRQDPGVEPDRIRYRLTLDRSGNHLTGPFKYSWADPVFPPGVRRLRDRVHPRERPGRAGTARLIRLRVAPAPMAGAVAPDRWR